MRYKAVFNRGAAVGFVAGARAGRGAYDKMVGYGQQNRRPPEGAAGYEHRPGQGQRAGEDRGGQGHRTTPRTRRQARPRRRRRQASQVPKYVSSAKQAAASRSQDAQGGNGDATDTNPVVEDNVDSDGNLV